MGCFHFLLSPAKIAVILTYAMSLFARSFLISHKIPHPKLFFPSRASIITPARAAVSTYEVPGKSSPSSSERVSNNNSCSSTSTIKQVYETLAVTELCGASCVLVRSPTPEQHTFLFVEAFDAAKQNLESGEEDEREEQEGRDRRQEQTVEGGSAGRWNKTLPINIRESVNRYTPEHDDMFTEELVFGRMKEKNNLSRLNKFLGGRIALRRALKQIDRGDVPPILRDDHGAPELPRDITGSISHKDDLAVGVAAIDSIGRVGVDIERCTNKAAPALLRRILTAEEKDRLGRIPGVPVEEEVLLRFSFKEAVYKAIHPFLERSVDFTEVEVDPQPDGSAALNFRFKTGEIFKYRAVWQRVNDNYWLTCVYVLP